MDFRGREETDFGEADCRYAELKRQRDAGTIFDEAFDAQRKQLMVKDDKGRWWAARPVIDTIVSRPAGSRVPRRATSRHPKGRPQRAGRSTGHNPGKLHSPSAGGPRVWSHVAGQDV